MPVRIRKNGRLNLSALTFAEKDLIRAYLRDRWRDFDEGFARCVEALEQDPTNAERAKLAIYNEHARAGIMYAIALLGPGTDGGVTEGVVEGSEG